MRKTLAPFSDEAESEASKDVEGWRKVLAKCSHQKKPKENPNKDTLPSEGSTAREQDKSDPSVCQQTLHKLDRADQDTWEDYKGRNGISIHGPNCQGPRVLLIFSGNTQEIRLKVTQSPEAAE